jgi:hypothetical protein
MFKAKVKSYQSEYRIKHLLLIHRPKLIIKLNQSLFLSLRFLLQSLQISNRQAGLLCNLTLFFKKAFYVQKHIKVSLFKLFFKHLLFLTPT